MERLTERFSNGQAAVKGCGNNCKWNFKYCDFNKENCPTLDEIYEKLAKYEEMEEQGLLHIFTEREQFLNFLRNPVKSNNVSFYYLSEIFNEEEIENMTDETFELCSQVAKYVHNACD